MSSLRATILIVAAISFLIILTQNTQVVALRFLFWRVQMSQIVLVLLCTLIGFAAGYVLAVVGSRRRERDRRVQSGGRA